MAPKIISGANKAMFQGIKAEIIIAVFSKSTSVAGKEFNSDPYISNVSYNYCIAISVPFKDSNGKINGVVMADVSIVN